MSNGFNRIVKVTDGWYKHYSYDVTGKVYVLDSEYNIVKLFNWNKLSLNEEVTVKEYSRQRDVDFLLILMYTVSMFICLFGLFKGVNIKDLLIILVCIGGIVLNSLLLYLKKVELIYCVNVFTVIQDRDDERNK